MQEQAQRNPDGTFPKGRSGNPRGRARKLPDQQIVPANYDGFTSQVTGIGTRTWDKRTSHFFCPTILSYQELITLWACSDMARRAVQDPIEDAHRQGWEFEIGDTGRKGDAGFIDDVHEELERLEWDYTMIRARCMERAIGGSAILLGANDNRPLSAPLNPLKANGIKWLSVLEPMELAPYSYETSVDSGSYGHPNMWMLTPFSTVSNFVGLTTPLGERSPPSDYLIHASRLIVFGGIRVSRYQISTNPGGSLWGESLLASTYEKQRDMEVAFHAASILATDAGQPAISMENLMSLLAKDPKAVKARLLALENGRSSARVILLDMKEKLERQSTEHLNGIPDLLAALMGRYAASIPMPVSRLMGASPKAIGTDVADEIRFYNDTVRTEQKRIVKISRPVLEMVMRSKRQRGLPKRWRQKFRDLVQLTDAEMAEAHLTQARTDSIYIKSGVTTSDEIRKARFFNGYSFDTQVDETKKAPGFQAPPPNGTPGSPHNPGPGALNSHPVTGYTRKNPTASGTEPAAKQGGDQAPGAGPNSRKDAANADEYVAMQRVRRATSRVKYSKRMQAAMDDAARQEFEAHAAGECDPEECPMPHGNSTGDGPGQRVMFAGLPIVIECARGTTREWQEPDGTTGSTLMKYDYGYIEGAIGVDGDCVDVYLGPDESAPWVYVVHQNAAPDFTAYDEDKCLIGWPSADAAKAAYEGQYDDPRYFGGMSQISLEMFRKRIFQQAGKIAA